MKMRTTRFLSLLLLTMLLAGSAGTTQAPTVRGKILRQSDGSVQPAVRVRVRLCYPNTNMQRCSPPVRTGEDGMFYFHNIPPGRYLLEVQAGEGQMRYYEIEVSSQEYTDIEPIVLPAEEL